MKVKGRKGREKKGNCNEGIEVKQYKSKEKREKKEEE